MAATPTNIEALDGSWAVSAGSTGFLVGDEPEATRTLMASAPALGESELAEATQIPMATTPPLVGSELEATQIPMAETGTLDPMEGSNINIATLSMPPAAFTITHRDNSRYWRLPTPTNRTAESRDVSWMEISGTFQLPLLEKNIMWIELDITRNRDSHVMWEYFDIELKVTSPSFEFNRSLLGDMKNFGYWERRKITKTIDFQYLDAPIPAGPLHFRYSETDSFFKKGIIFHGVSVKYQPKV